MDTSPKEDPRRPTVKLIGADGNAYSIMGKVCAALREAGYSPEEQDEYAKQAMSSDYNNLIRVSCDWADVPMCDDEEEA
jgi:coproporphyrinogen III oxidase-like Fe-S oxidoreductase